MGASDNRQQIALDATPEAEFDALVAATALVCEVPVALVSLIDSGRQRLKARVGVTEVPDLPSDLTFCAHAILGTDVFEIADATLDPRFASNPVVAGEAGFRFYAGAPLRPSNGEAVGTLCVLDRQPRQLTDAQRATLLNLAAATTAALEARETTKQFRQSEARFRALTESSPLGVFETDAEGMCTYTNSRWQAMYGMTGEEALGWGWSRTLHPDDKAGIANAWQRAAEARTDFEHEFRVRHDDGTLRFLRSMSRPVLNDDGKVTCHVGSVKDITDRKLQEIQLQKSQLLLSRTGALAEVGGWEFDLVAGSLEWSEHTRRIHGVADDYQPSLDSAINFYAPEARGVIQAAVERSMADGTPWDLELPFIQASGARIWVRAVGCAEFAGATPVRLVGSFQNISQRVEQRQALEAARNRLALAAESGGFGVWDLDVRSGDLLWDEWMYRLYGLAPRSDATAYDLWARHLHPDDRERAEQALQDALAGHAEFKTEFRVVWNDGSVHHLRAAAQITRDESGVPLRMVGMNWDVTAMHQLTAELSAQHELLRVTLLSIGDGVITTDASGRVTWLNPVAEHMTGWLSNDAAGRPVSEVFRAWQADSPDALGSPVETCLRENATCSFGQHMVLRSTTGAEFGIEESAAPIRDAAGVVVGAVLVFRDVTEQRRAVGEIRHQASHDALTGLVNRAEFDRRLAAAWQSAQREMSGHAMLFIDLDQFKSVNDTCGHAAGDQLLQLVAATLVATVRSRDTVARLGGDEFGVLLTDCNDEQAERVAQQLCDRIRNLCFVHNERQFTIGASIGLVPVDSRWATIEDATRAADASCYAAKKGGRNQVFHWRDGGETLPSNVGDFDWAAALESALSDGSFVLHAQRIEALSQRGDGLRAEVLLRMIAPDGQLIAPGAFLPMAARFHLASRIDRWVLGNVVQALQEMPDVSRVDMLSINISAQSLADSVFHRQAVELLTAAGRDVCARLCLEIPEVAVITNLAEATPFIGQVRALGVRVALDDFGAIASTFSYLKSLEVDVLNIDGQFVRQIAADPLAAAAVRCFVDIATVLGVKTVAKFGDRPDVLEQVRELGVDFAQGYRLHSPESLRDSLERIVRQPADVMLELSAAAVE